MKRLTELRKLKGITQQELAKYLNIDRTSIGKYEKHDVVPSKDVLFKIADYFGVSVDYLLGKESIRQYDNNVLLSNSYRSLINLYDNANKKAQVTAKSVLELGQIKKPMFKHELDFRCENELAHIPVVGKAAAGTPIEMIECYYDDILRLTDSELRPGDFAVIASGDSMIEADIDDGDKVIIRPCSTVDNGTIALVAVGDGSTIKRFYKTDAGFELRPANDAYPIQQYNKTDNIRILGRFIKVVGQND